MADPFDTSAPLPYAQMVILEALNVSTLLWSAASATAINHHTGSVMKSPGAMLKAVEWWMWTQRINPLMALPRYLAQGTTQEPNYDVMSVDTDMAAMIQTRTQLYADMCRNCFNELCKGPGNFKRYTEHVEQRHKGLLIASGQFFDAVRKQNDDIAAAIDLSRRRLYTTRVACEALMVVLGAGTIPLGIQLGVGIGYVLATNLITYWAGMEKADIVAMPGKVTRSTAAGVAANLAQEGVDIASDQIRIFEGAQQAVYAREQARIDRRIAEIVAEGKRRGGNRGELKRLYKLRAATGQAATQAESKASQLASGAARGAVRLGGIAVGFYFMKEDLSNVVSFIDEGLLTENPSVR